MLEIHDELMTPGCPQCAVKHLSAMLYWRAHTPLVTPNGVSFGGTAAILCRTYLAVAKINLTEVLNGYRSHLWYAVGALVAAEECALELGGEDCTAKTARAARLSLEEGGLGAVRDALVTLTCGCVLRAHEMAEAHWMEARRELPGFNLDYSDPIGSIERIRGEFFDFDEAPAASDEKAEKGGEGAMTKKTMKKAAAKATKAALKAAPAKKAKQAACKGGKCKSCKK